MALAKAPTKLSNRDRERILHTWRAAYTRWASAGEAFAQSTRDLGQTWSRLDDEYGRTALGEVGLDQAGLGDWLTLFTGSDHVNRGGGEPYPVHNPGQFEIAVAHARALGWLPPADDAA